MILRKPYAFLIKNFKLIHAIMTVLMGYIFYKTLNILSVFNDYFSSQVALIGADASARAYPATVFIAPILIIIMSLILLWVMAIKNKPKNLYIVNIVIYIFIIVVFALGRSTMLNMEINVLDIRLIKVARDLTTFSFIFQLFPLAKSFVRTVGFDIKQFDFGKDLAELEIEEKDNEEFEVNVSVDTNKMKRGINFRERIFKYIIKENKVLVIIVSSIFVVIVGSIITYTILSNNTFKSMNTIFNISNFNIKVTDAYATRKNYKGNAISSLNEKMSLVVIAYEVSNNSILDKGFLTANVMLDIGSHRFRNKPNYRDSVYDLGTVYDGEEIVGKSTEYRTFIFEVPTSYLNNKMYLRFVTAISFKGKDLIPTYISVPIKIVDLNDINSRNIINSNEDTDMSSTILRNSIININSIEIAKKFKIDYTYNLNGEAISSYEYISAPLETNVDRSLLKMTAALTLDERLNLNTMYDLISYYGSLKYTIDNKIKTITSLPKVDPAKTKSSKVMYIAVPSEVENAESISLIFSIRDAEYEYKIK